MKHLILIFSFILVTFSITADAKPGRDRGPRMDNQCFCPEGAVRMGPHCWFLGEKGQACDSVCAKYDRKDVTPEQSNERLCRRLSRQFIMEVGDLNVSCQNLVGCHVWGDNGKVERCTGKVTTNANYSKSARFCACARN